MVDSNDIRTTVGRREVSRQDVLAWESRRADMVLAKFAARLGARGAEELQAGPTISELRGASLDTRREALAALKLRLGHAGVYAVLKRELALSERLARISARVSRARPSTRLPGSRPPAYRRIASRSGSATLSW